MSDHPTLSELDVASPFANVCTYFFPSRLTRAIRLDESALTTLDPTP